MTKRDLGPVGSFCMMGLFGLVGFGLLSMFFPSLMGEGASFVFSIVGIIVFAGLTAYDTQKIKAMNVPGREGTDAGRKKAIFGALSSVSRLHQPVPQPAAADGPQTISFFETSPTQGDPRYAHSGTGRRTIIAA